MSVGRLWILVGLGGAVLAAFLIASVLLPMLLGPANLVSFTTIEKGPQGSVRAEVCAVARNMEDWTTLWGEHNRGTFHILPLPQVDFAREIVLGCFLDRQPTCCVAHVTIVGIQVTETGYEVSVDRNYTQWGPESPSYPFHFVRVQRTEGSITFIDARTGDNIPVIAIEASS